MAVDRSNACFYLWGGRGGKDMSAIATRSSADEDADAVDDLWRFDTKKESWEKTVSKGAFPEGRSFHTMAMLENHLYVHAGCTAAGRLASLESLDCKSAAWSAQPPAPGPARGGTVLTAIPSHRDDGRLVLARWGGFCGNELGGPLDIFDPVQGEWTSHSASVEGGEADPRKRSVHGFVPITPPLRLGHDGAGKFLSDYYILLQSEQGYRWRPLNDVARSALPRQTLPEARGWFAFDCQALDDGRSGVRVVLHGGLNEQNERLSDAWVLEIESAAA
ncbi:hypothetical protein FA10DRAFT_137 [Acaromyces ingoldii]|uniref:Galactose oxidase n=1 Tax=Acaromyces ingoldii TaxID=215250 RepID=A0A316YT72_9BASI|nr:hypothetical protein FA10DRAFT_137 [Acaromyces ingoldii]PWN92607.1 hypothetical protein FA10DRAFT_137 [Acaromyces ingoldii]